MLKRKKANIKKMVKVKKKKEKPSYNLWQNSAFMISFAWKKQKSVIWLCIAVCIVRVLSRVLQLFLAPTILKRVELKSSFQEMIMTIVFFSLGLMLCYGLISYISTNTLFGRVRVRSSLTNMIHTKLCMTSYPNTEDSKVLKKLDKAQMAVNGNNQATEAIWDTLTNVIHDIICLLICFTLLTALNPLLMLMSLATTASSYFINKKINEWGYQHREEEAEYSKRMNYIVKESDNISLAKDIRIFGMRPWLEEIFQKTMRLYQAFVLRGEKIYIWTNIIDLTFTFFRNGVIYAYLIGLTIRQALPASEFLLYFSAINDFTARVGYVLWNFGHLHKQSLDICNLREFLEISEPFLFEKGKPLKPVQDGKYEICLENVSFQYPEAEENTINNINLTIHVGEKLAIVGLNGAGKTTLVKLICGFYDPTKGRVLLNGVDIREYNRRDYYLHFAAVFQQFSMMEAPIEVNIAQETLTIDKQKVSICLEKSGLTNKIHTLTSGIKTPIGKKVFEEGIELSGGETQRLMLSRALYKDAPIIVLDEPTAALDPIAESDMYLKYSDFTSGRTSVYISHRLASTRFCDRIIYLENGRIAEEGTHSGLLSKKGKYAELFQIQSKYYREGVEKAKDEEQ